MNCAHRRVTHATSLFYIFFDPFWISPKTNHQIELYVIDLGVCRYNATWSVELHITSFDNNLTDLTRVSSTNGCLAFQSTAFAQHHAGDRLTQAYKSIFASIEKPLTHHVQHHHSLCGYNINYFIRNRMKNHSTSELFHQCRMFRCVLRKAVYNPLPMLWAQSDDETERVSEQGREGVTRSG